MQRMKADASVAFIARDIAPLSGTPQYASSGNPGVSAATVDTAYHQNMMMDELMSFIEAAGAGGDDTEWSQVWQYLFRAFTFVDTGTAAALVVSPPTMTWPFLAASLGPGTGFRVIAGHAPAIAATLNFAGTGAKPLVRWDGSALFGGEWKPGTIFEVIYDGTSYRVVSALERIVLGVSPILNINASSGSDVTGDGSVARPFQTQQHARNVAQTYDFGGLFAPGYICTGAFTAGVRCAGALIGQSGPESWQFASGAAVAAPNSDCFTVSAGAIATVSGGATPVLLSTSGSFAGSGYSIQCLGGSNVIVLGGVNFGTCYAAHIGASLGSVALNNNYTISGGATAHFSVFLGGGVINTNLNSPQTVTLLGTPNFSGAFASINTPGQISSQGVTWSGGATGQRYNAQLNGIIQTNGSGASYFPGSVAGATATGGQYA